MKWHEEIKASKKREKDFREDGKKILDVYQGIKTPFNILYSNTETLLPALFSQLPRPVISRRFKDEDPMGKVIAEAGQRMLEYLQDTDLDEYDPFYEGISDVTLDGLLPGRGNASIKYESDDDVTWEKACIDVMPWDRVYYGYAKKWTKVPWVAYEYFLDKDEAKKLKIDHNDIVYKENEEVEEKRDTEELGKRKTACFYQIWVKKKRKVIWISDQVSDSTLKEDEDPLELSGFFNCPKPLQFVKRPSDLVPIALYTLYKNQAEELNKIQGRINKIVDAIKARGVYDGTLGKELENLFKEADNALVPTDQSSSLVDGALDKAIWFAPVEKLIVVLQQLFQAREACKSVIYEITGISDIIRGQSVASETLGAQQIKESWGTMRLKRLQKEVQRYALDVMKIMLEIAITKFSEESWKNMTQLPYPLTEEKERAQQQLQNLQEQYQLLTQQAQGMQPPPPPPEVQKLQKIASQPSWGEILGILKDDYQRSYRLDIETNSTLDVEATEDKQHVGEFMNALAQVMAGFANDQNLPFRAKKSIILAVTKRFRFGREVEDELNAMQEPQPQIPPEIQQQIQQAQQQVQQAQQQLEKEQQSVEQEKRNLAEERIKMDFDKRLAEEQLKFDERLAEERLKLDEEMAENQLKRQEIEIENNIKQLILKGQQTTQSMLDKHLANVEKMVG